MNYIKILAYTLSLTLLIGCQSKLLTVHKIDVQQGNALDIEMVNKVEIGMTQDQVQYVLGSPLITDSFHPDRWDYIYFFIPGYGEQEKRQLTLIFDRGEVIEINKHNIAESSIASDSSKGPEVDDKKETENNNQEDELSEKDQEDLEALEKQADTLEEVLQENKNLDN
ncbi:MAG: outer membrane protein assembly factor BamE [Gammaproteobacteria bacterium]